MRNLKKPILHCFFILFLALQGGSSNAQTTGLLYGMTFYGGSTNFGVLFRYDPVNNKDSILINFNNPYWAHPYGNLIQGLDGKLYGLTVASGGSLFSYNVTNGTGAPLFYFTGPNGFSPTGSLIQATDSLLYGLTAQGGTSNDGVLFSYNTTTGKDSVRFNFNGTNGRAAGGSLLQAKDGKLYGMTQLGGSSDSGVLFSFDPKTGKDTVLVNFTKAIGVFPYYGSLIQDTNGLLYGMTSGGGLGNGVLFSYNPITGKDTVLVNFTSPTGYSPFGSLIHDTKGILYGMTYYGGAFVSYGTLFSYNPVSATYTVLFSFNPPNGANPYGSLIQASNGLLFGMTYNGGINSSGSLFNFDLSTNTETKLIDLNVIDGIFPYGDLTEVMEVYTKGKDSVSCFGDSNDWVKMNVRGAKMPLTYLWSNGATTDSVAGLTAGKYVCKVKDSRGITITDTIIIRQPTKLILSPTVSNVCFGDSNGIARPNASGGTQPYTYLWNNGATTDSIWGLKPGSKDTCIVTDANGCTASTNFIITQASSPLKIDSITFTPATWPTYANGTATVWVSGGIPPGDSTEYYYLWTYGIDTLTGPQPVRYSTVISLVPGVDSVCITSGYYKCGTICTSVNVPMGITSLTKPVNEVKIYPVPSNGQVAIGMQGNGYTQLTISDELGRTVFYSHLNPELSNSILPLNLDFEPNGVYIVQIIAEQGTITRKLVIQR